MPKKKSAKKRVKSVSTKENSQLSPNEIAQIVEDEVSKSPNTTEVPQTKQNQDKQFYYVLGAMAGLILVFLIAHSFFQGLNSFEYEGLSFTKEKMGEIQLFHYYYFITPSKVTGSAISEGNPKLINLYVRNDPRENNIPVDGEIELGGKSIYITLNATGLEECPYSSLALAGLGSFISGNEFKLEAGVNNQEEAMNGNMSYITCEKYPSKSVILIQAGEKTSIVRENNCYTLTVANCEILPATEKFMIQAIIDAKSRAGL